MNLILDTLSKLSKFNEYTDLIKIKKGPVVISGLSDVGKIEFIAGTYENINRPILIVTYNDIQVKKIVENLNYFEDDVELFPKREIVAYDFIAESKDLPYKRIDILNKLDQNKPCIIVTTIEALMQKMISRDTLYKNVVSLKVGDTYEFNLLKEKLVALGYERCDLVESRGQFSIRGGIVDFAIDDKKGIRIEFWGDDVDSIREFNILSQRSDEMLDNIVIKPAHELLLEDSLDSIADKIENQSDAEQIREGDYLNKIDKYFNDFYSIQNTFLDYLGDEFVVLVDDYMKVKQRHENIIMENNNLINSLIEKNRFVPQSIENISNYKFDFSDMQVVYMQEQDIGMRTLSNIKFVFNYRDVNYYKSEIEILFEDIKKNINNKKIIVLAGSEEEANKFGKLLLEKDIPNKVLTSSMQSIKKGKNKLEDKDIFEDEDKRFVTIMQGRLSGGYENYDLGLIVISGDELFSSTKKKRRFSKAFKQGERVVFQDLKVGDYVVHNTHGIGQFIGVNTIKTLGNITKDYIKIRYKNDDMLYIPTNDLDSIRKYIGEGEAAPKINRLRQQRVGKYKSKS